MKKWKIVRMITIIILIMILFFVIQDIITCMNMEYPRPMLGIDAYNWTDQFRVNFIFCYLVPLIVDIIIFVISCKKIRSHE